jgi:ribosome-associated protein
LESKKAEDILLLDVTDISSFTDYFILCNGTSSRMLNSLVDAVVEICKNAGGRSCRIEGNPDAGWIVSDAGDTVIHLFSPDQREYYDLEGLWSKGRVLIRLT